MQKTKDTQNLMEATRNMNLFAYGTLMWPEVLEAVINRPLIGTPASLRGFLRIRVKGACYPALIESRSRDVVEGMLYRDLTEEEFRHLDRFEGDEYERREVLTEADQAHVYVLSHARRHLADSRPWSPEDMGVESLEAFCREYKGRQNR
ncbi:MAG TPA: gamma-glutamylcyclotransferase family protein [Pontiella sp.]|nr:gamma-glutamylcyclotransferase family protein [Pontiella sp.]